MMPPRRTPGQDGDAGDPQMEQRLRSWLGAETAQPPESLATATMSRARRTRQVPGWVARLRRGQNGGPPRMARLTAATASIAAGAVVVVVLWQAASVPFGDRPSPAPSSTTAASTPTGTAPVSSVGASPALFDGRAQVVVDLERRGTAIGTGFESLWLGDEAGRLLRIDPVAATITSTTELGGVACGPIIAAASSIWLTTCGSGVATDAAVTLRVDPATGVVANRYDTGGGDGIGFAAMNGLVWFVSDVQQGRLTAVDAETGAPVRELTVGAPIRHMTAGFGFLWVSPIGRPAVLRLDPVTGAQRAEIALSGDSGYLVTGVDAIWVAEPHQWLVGRIDPVADRLSAESGAPRLVAHLLIDDAGMVWALGEAEAMRLDPSDNRTIDQFPVPAHLGFDAVGTHVFTAIGEAAWFADGLELLRINPSP